MDSQESAKSVVDCCEIGDLADDLEPVCEDYFFVPAPRLTALCTQNPEENDFQDCIDEEDDEQITEFETFDIQVRCFSLTIS